MSNRIFPAAVLAAFLLGVGCAKAQAPITLCLDRDAVVRDLKEKYGEVRVAVGVSRTGALLEVFASRSGSWTVLLTAPNGPACVAATGMSWEMFPPLIEA